MHVVILMLLVVKPARIIYMTTCHTEVLYIRCVSSAENISILSHERERIDFFLVLSKKRAASDNVY